MPSELKFVPVEFTGAWVGVAILGRRLGSKGGRVLRSPVFNVSREVKFEYPAIAIATAALSSLPRMV